MALAVGLLAGAALFGLIWAIASYGARRRGPPWARGRGINRSGPERFAKEDRQEPPSGQTS